MSLKITSVIYIFIMLFYFHMDEKYHKEYYNSGTIKAEGWLKNGKKMGIGNTIIKMEKNLNKDISQIIKKRSIGFFMAKTAL